MSDQVERTCAACGESGNPERAKFCISCAAPLPDAPAEETRKTVSVVFADLAGSTALQEALDPESARHVMGRFYAVMREAIEAEEGRVEKFIGDAVVAVFGTPLVREDDALRALRAAAGMVEALTRLNRELEDRWGVQLRLRTGVNTGEVVISRDGFMVGDTMNTAARLEQAAPEGEVLVGERTARLVRHEAELEPVQPLELKGKSEPVPAYRLLGLGRDHTPDGPQLPLDSPLVGRRAEVEALLQVFGSCVAERSCRLACVIGSPGIGKTRLASEFVNRITDQVRVLEGRCEPSGEGITWLPVAEVIRAAAGIDDADGDSRVERKLTDLLRAEEDDRRLIVSRLGGVLGTAPQTSPEETFWAVRRLLEAIADDQPLVVVLDDVHWGQPTFLDLIEHLVDWGRGSIFILALARPELRDLAPDLAESGRLPRAVVELEPLDEEASQSLIDRLLGAAELPEVLADRILETTGGNPLFLGETLRMLVDDGVLQREGETWTAAEGSAAEVPPTIQALLAARIDRLAAEQRTVVERAAVIGKQFYRGAVAELAPEPVAVGIDDHLDALRRKEMVLPEGTFFVDEPVFRFHHILIRDAAYNALLKEVRAELHERFVEWLEGKAGEVVGEHEEVIAFHLEQAHEYRRQLGPLDENGRELGARAARRLHSAGRRALERDDLPAAENLLTRALDRLESSDPGRAEPLVDLCEARLSAGRAEAAAPAIAELRELAAGEARLQALANVFEGERLVLSDPGELGGAADQAATAAAVLAAAEDPAGEAKAHHVRARALAQLGRVGDTEAALDEALAAARRAGDERRSRAILAGAPRAALWGPSPLPRASGRCLDVVRILRMSTGARHVEGAALRCQAVLEALRGRADAARQIIANALTGFEELGLALEIAETRLNGGIVELICGDADAAERELRLALGGFQALGAESGAAYAAALLARALLASGREADAWEMTQLAEQHAGEDLKAAVAWRAARAEVLSSRGEHADATDLARTAVGIAAATDALIDHADARMTLASVLRAADQETAGCSEAEVALELYRRKEAPEGIARAEAFLGDRRAAREDADAPQAATPVPFKSSAWQVVERYYRSYADRDWQLNLELHDAACRVVDHSRFRWGEMSAEQAVEMHKQFTEHAPGIVERFEPVAEEGDNVLWHWWGGGTAESPDVEIDFAIDGLTVAAVEGGRFTRLEYFESDAEEQALAKMRELAGSGQRGEVRPNLVTSSWKLWADAYNRRDRDALLDRYSADFRGNYDHRFGVQNVVEEREILIEGHVSTWELGGEDLQVEIIPLATLADRFATAHARISGAEGVAEILVTVEVDDVGRNLEDHIFDLDERDAAIAKMHELADRAGEGGEPVRPNLVTRSWELWCEAYNRRDRAALLDRYSDNYRVHDHRFGLQNVVEGAEANVEGHVGTWQHADLRIEITPIATVGERFAVGQLKATGPGLELELLDVAEMTPSGQSLLDHLYEPHEREKAIAKMHELAATAETQADAAADHSPAVATHRQLVTAVRAADWDRVGELVAPDVRVRDHRDLGWEPSGAEGLVSIWRGFAELVDDVTHDVEILKARAEHLLVSWRGLGTDPADLGGGQIEVPLAVCAQYSDGRVVAVEFFEGDEAGFAQAEARFAELVGGEEPAQSGIAESVRPNAVTRSWELWCEAYNRRDSEAMLDRCAAGYEAHDHRFGLQNVARAEAQLEGHASIWDEYDPTIEITPIATLGEELGVGMLRATGAAFEIEMVILGLTDDEGLALADHLFEPDEREKAIAKMHELADEDRDATAEPQPELRSQMLLNRWSEAFVARDLEGMAAVVAAEAVLVDNRAGIGGGAVYDGVDQLLKRWKNTLDLIGGGRMEADVSHALEACETAGLNLQVARGQTGSGIEAELENLVVHTNDGRCLTHIEIFDKGDEPAARQRYRELAPADQEVAATGWEGVPTIDLARRWAQLYSDHDFEGLRELIPDDTVIIDHRSTLGGGAEVCGADAIVERWRQTIELVPDFRVKVSKVVAATETVCLFANRAWGHLADGGGEMELEFLIVALVEEGLARAEFFDLDAEDDALRRFEELVAERARTIDSRGPLEHLELFRQRHNARDPEGLLQMFAPDFHLVDRRRIGWGEFDGPERYVEHLTSLFESTTEHRTAVFRPIRFDAEHVLSLMRVTGQLREGGGAFETEMLFVGSRRDGLTTRVEFFDSSDRALALERFIELAGERGPDSSASPLRDRAERWRRLHNDRDWAGIRSLHRSDQTLIDRRKVGWGELKGIDAVMERLEAVVELAPDVEIPQQTFLAIGRRTTLADHRARGHLKEGGGPFEIGFLILSVWRDGQIAHTEFFEREDEAAARSRFDELEISTDDELPGARQGAQQTLRQRDGGHGRTRPDQVAGSGPPPARDPLGAVNRRHESYGAFNGREWSRVAEFNHESFSFSDRRPLAVIGELEGLEQWEHLMRTTVSLAEDAKWQFEPLLVYEAVELNIHRSWQHLGSDGGMAANEGLQVVQSDQDGRQVRLEFFGLDDLDGALCRVYELGGRGPQPGAAIRTALRLLRALNERDWETAQTCLGEDLEVIDDRPGAAIGSMGGRGSWLKAIESKVEVAGDTRWWLAPVADLDGLAAARVYSDIPSGAGGGEFESPCGVVAEIDSTGRFTTLRFVDSDPELLRRVLDDPTSAQTPGSQGHDDRVAGAGPPAADDPEEIVASVRKAYGVFNERDWDRLGEVITESFIFRDRRTPPIIGDLEGRDQFNRLMQTTVSLAADARWIYEPLLVYADVELRAHRSEQHMGDASGLSVNEALAVSTLEEGRISRIELFDGDSADRALERVYELAGSRSRPGRGIRTALRLFRALNARDWEAVREVLGEHLEIIDDRPASAPGSMRGRERWLEALQSIIEIADDAHWWIAPVADRGDQVAGRVYDQGHWNDGGGEFTISLGAVADTDSAGRFTMLRFTDPAPSAPWHAPDDPSPATIARRWRDALNGRDWERLAAIYSPDLQVTDHRALGWGELTGPTALVDRQKALVELAPDIHEEPLQVIAEHGNAALFHHRAAGHVADGGGDFEIEFLIAARFVEWLATHIELFDLDDEPAALARVEELAALPSVSMLASDDDGAGPVAALARRWTEVLNARRWNAADQVVAAELEMIDHRPGSPIGELRGRAAWLQFQKSAVSIASDVRWRAELYEEQGNVGHGTLTVAGTFDEGGGAWENVMACVVCLDGAGLAAFMELFAEEDREHAIARFRHLVEQGEASAPDRAEA